MTVPGAKRRASGAKLGNSIRKLRFEAGEMTQEQLAQRVGVTRQTIMAIEGAKYSPSLELAFRIADAFGRPIQDVFRYATAGGTAADALASDTSGSGR